MHRLLFQKEGNAIWLSHLDLMRVFQRAFRRANLLLKHSQGFTPHPAVSMLLPLSVGVSSCCELMDFELDPKECIDAEDIPALLNATLPVGIHVLRQYDDGRKPKELTFLQCEVSLVYDNGVPDDAVRAISQLFQQEELLVEKRSKNGETLVNVIPMIDSLVITQQEWNALLINAVVCAQNPSLNPMLLVHCIKKYLPKLRPDFASYRRVEVLDVQRNVFR